MILVLKNKQEGHDGPESLTKESLTMKKIGGGGGGGRGEGVTVLLCTYEGKSCLLGQGQI